MSRNPYETESPSTEKGLRGAIDPTAQPWDKRVDEILSKNDLESIKRKLLVSNLKRVLDEFRKNLSRDPNGDTNEEYLKALVLGTNAAIYRKLLKILGDPVYQLTESTISELFTVMKTSIYQQMSYVEILSYVMKSFPLFSKLKRLLLKERRNTKKKQYEYIFDNYSSSVKLSWKDEFDFAGNKYMQISNNTAAFMIAALVDHETNYTNHQYINLIRDGWFHNNTLDTPGQHTVEPMTLFRIAYAFALDVKGLEYICESAEKGVWNALDPEQNILRFGLQYHFTYNEALQLVLEYQPKFVEQNNRMGNQKEVQDAIMRFFQENPSREDSTKMRYYELLERMGIAKAALSEEQRLKKKRCIIASDYIKKICEFLTPECIKTITSRIAYNTDQLDEVIELFRSVPQWQGQILLDHDRLTGLFHENGEAMRKVRTLTSDDAKATFLNRFCDGPKVYQCIYTGTPLTTGLIKKLQSFNKNNKNNENNENSENTELFEIDRGIILRLAYLQTVIPYLSGQLEKPLLISTFEETANLLLQECLFHPVNISFPLDLIMYLALSEKNVYQPAVYQFLIPRKQETPVPLPRKQ